MKSVMLRRGLQLKLPWILAAHDASAAAAFGHGWHVPLPIDVGDLERSLPAIRVTTQTTLTEHTACTPWAYFSLTGIQHQGHLDSVAFTAAERQLVAA